MWTNSFFLRVLSSSIINLNIYDFVTQKWCIKTRLKIKSIYWRFSIWGFFSHSFLKFNLFLTNFLMSNFMKNMTVRCKPTFEKLCYITRQILNPNRLLNVESLVCPNLPPNFPLWRKRMFLYFKCLKNYILYFKYYLTSKPM